MTVTSVTVATTKYLFGMYDYTVGSNVGTDEFSLVLRLLHGCGHAHVSPGIDCFLSNLSVLEFANCHICLGRHFNKPAFTFPQDILYHYDS